MNEYMPTAEQIRSRYSRMATVRGTPMQSKRRRAEFDRWLAQVKAEVWDEGFTYGHYNPGEPKECDCRVNPYRPERTTS